MVVCNSNYHIISSIPIIVLPCAIINKIMGFTVETLKFEGPLDLMLHLIKEQELDIFDLDMEVLTDQYIKYLHEMEKLELEIESEYLVELATLIEYKSRKLLPKKSDDLQDDYQEDPKERLVQRLLEYQK